MFVQAGKDLLVRIQFSWRPLFQRRYLMLTNTLSAGALLALGDVVQQGWETHSQPGRVLDWRRIARMFVVGCSMGPPMHYWYSWLDKVCVGRTLNMVGKKVLADQLVASPALAVWYFLALNVMEGQSLSYGCEELKDKFWEIYKADWCVWPATQMINFYLLSPKFRVVYINVVGLGWNVYVSYLKHRDDNNPSEDESKSPEQKA